MKKLSIISLLLAACSIAVAASHGPAGSPIGTDGELTSCAGGSCGHVQAHKAPFIFGVKVTEGSAVLNEGRITASEGDPTPFVIGSEHQYVGGATRDGDKVVLKPATFREGLWMTLTPMRMQDGTIEVVVSVELRELVKLHKIKAGELYMEAPEIKARVIEKTVAVESGKDAEITFGPYVVKLASIEG